MIKQIIFTVFFLVISVCAAAGDKSTGVLVIGAGGAGLTAAITLAEAGREVLLIDKSDAGGDTMRVTAWVRGGGSRLNDQLGVKNASAEDYYNWILEAARKQNLPINKDNVRAYALRSGEMINWLLDLGVPFIAYNPEQFQYFTENPHNPGPHLIAALRKEAARLGVKYIPDTRAVSLIVDNGKVAGAKVETKDGGYAIHAKAVILATGGYASNPELIEKYNHEWAGLPGVGASSSTGDGLRMAMGIGAAVSDMQNLTITFPSYRFSSGGGVSMKNLRGIMLVNIDGKRYVDESHPSEEFRARQTILQKDGKAWLIVDQQLFDKKNVFKYYLEQGYMTQADSIEALAAVIGVNKTNLIVTVKERYPEASGGYYAMPVTPGIMSTEGGLTVDSKGHVLDGKAKIISGLYAAGMVSGHNIYANVLGGASISAMTYGRICAETATAEWQEKSR